MRRIHNPPQELSSVAALVDQAAQSSSSSAESFELVRDAYEAFLAHYDKQKTNSTNEILRTLIGNLVSSSARADKDSESRASSKIAVPLLERTLRLTLTKGKLNAESKKWASLNVVNAILRLNFRLNHSSAFILRYVDAPSFVEIERFPSLSDRTMFAYYRGRHSLMNGDASTARELLLEAFETCRRSESALFKRNSLRIAEYLLPANLMTGVIPSDEFLIRFPSLKARYFDLTKCVRKGDLSNVCSHLVALREHTYMRLRIGLPFESDVELVTVRRIVRIVHSVLNEPKTLSFESILLGFSRIGSVDATEDRLIELLAELICRKWLRGLLVFERRALAMAGSNPFPKLR